jgi:DNA-binding response OmpR family regulator
MTRVLLAEDDDEVRMGLEKSLARKGFEVVSVGNAGGLETKAKEGFDIILSDTDLRDGWGDIICKKLFEEGKINDSFLVGMSSARDYLEGWTGVAHDTLLKDGMRNIGETINFLYSDYLRGKFPRRYKVFK